MALKQNLEKNLNGKAPYAWAKNYIAELNKKEKEKSLNVMVKYPPTKLIDKAKVSFNGGYLSLQKIYHKLSLQNIYAQISERHKFTFVLDSILSRLLYGRIIFPGSKLSTHNLASTFLEPPNFKL